MAFIHLHKGADLKNPTQIGIIGTGFIATGLMRAIEQQPDMVVSSILTRRDVNDLPTSAPYTNSVDEFDRKKPAGGGMRR